MTEEKFNRLNEIKGRTGLVNPLALSTGDLEFLITELENAWSDLAAIEALEKTEDTRKIGHKEPDAYTTLGCLSHIASEAIVKIRGNNG